MRHLSPIAAWICGTCVQDKQVTERERPGTVIRGVATRKEHFECQLILQVWVFH